MLALIGGTGLYQVPGLVVESKKIVDTPFGLPSSEIIQGTLEGKPLLFLARHGEGHRTLPHEINYRANIFALKSAGARAILSVSAVGSLREELAPGDFVCVDQYIDFTKGRRASSFFGEGVAAHIATAMPSSKCFLEWLDDPADRKLHRSGTYICVEGPRLGTRAESLMFRSWGADVVGMTNVPEAFLAREAQMGYVSIGIVTDFDSWMEDPSKHVDVSQIFPLYRRSLNSILTLISGVVKKYDPDVVEKSPERSALKYAVITDDAVLSPSNREWLNVLRA